jgi:hypothetical protein
VKSLSYDHLRVILWHPSSNKLHFLEKNIQNAICLEKLPFLIKYAELLFRFEVFVLTCSDLLLLSKLKLKNALNSEFFEMADSIHKFANLMIMNTRNIDGDSDNSEILSKNTGFEIQHFTQIIDEYLRNFYDKTVTIQVNKIEDNFAGLEDIMRLFHKLSVFREGKFEKTYELIANSIDKLFTETLVV